MTATAADARPAEPATATRPRLPLAIALLVGGVAAFIVGGALAWGANPMVGFFIGGAGIAAIVVGAILARNAMVGRYLEGGGER
jgi:hypothetical protein